MLSPQDVLYFESIALTKNLRAAAEALHITQPALSHSLRRLEAAYGAALFERTSKGLKLTSDGVRLLEKSKIALHTWRDLLIHDETGALTPRNLRIGMHPSVATYFAPGFLKQARAVSPQLGLELSHGLSRDLTRLVIDGDLDAAVAMNPVRSPGLVIRQVLTDWVTVVATRAAAKSEHIIYDPALAQSQWILKSLERRGLRFKSETHSGSLEVIRSLAEAGLGAAILPLRVAALATVPLHEALPDGPKHLDRLCFVCRPHFVRTAFGRQILDAAKNAGL